MKTLYIFGNEYLKDDSFAKEVADVIKAEIEDINLVSCSSPDFLLDAKEKEILILDVVKNITKPIIIKDISQLKTRKIITLHDFDLAFFLKLLQGIGINKKIKIIGIPQTGDISKIGYEVKKCVQEI